MKQKLTNSLATLLTLAIIITCIPLFGLNAYANEVDTSKDNSAEPKTEQGIGQADKVIVDGITYEIANKAKKTAKVTASEKNIEIATIKPTVKINGENYKVMWILSKAFAKRKSLKKVVIGKNIKGISGQVFYKDTKLKTVVFKGKKLVIVLREAFKGTHKKITFKVPRKVYNKYKKVLKRTGLPKKAKFVKY